MATLSDDLNCSVLDPDEFNDDLRTTILPLSVFVGIEAVLGFFGNLVVLFAFAYRYHNCSFRYFVLCLALFDFTASFTTIPGEVVTQLYWYVYPVPAVCKIKSFFNLFTVFGEAFCLLTIAVDRYRKVCRPLGWQITPRSSRILCGVILGLSTAIAIPAAIFWGIQKREIHRQAYAPNGENGVEQRVRVNVTLCEIDQNFMHSSTPRYFTYFLETIIALSLVPMFVLYILVVKTLIVSRRLIDERPAANKSQKKTSRDNTSGEEAGYRTDNSSTTCSTADHKLAGHDPRAPPVDLPGIGPVEMCSEPPQSQPTPPAAKPRRRATGGRRHGMNAYVRRKTVIMLVLTVVFMVTTVTYLTMLGFIADDILDTLTNSEKTVFFFFFRLYFVNHVINPAVYGLLDPEFRRAIVRAYRKVKSTCATC